MERDRDDRLRSAHQSGNFAIPQLFHVAHGEHFRGTRREFADGLAQEPDELPSWLTPEDIDTYVTEYASSGFTGPLNWYRSMDRNWELTAPWAGAQIRQPALFIAGQQLGKECRTLLGKVDAIFLDLSVAGFHHIIRLERFDETIDHRLRGDRLLIFLLVASGNGFKQRDNVVENTSPQRRVHLGVTTPKVKNRTLVLRVLFTCESVY